jgi:hypothetical protein
VAQRITECHAMKAHPDDYLNVPANSSPEVIESSLALVLQQHRCPDLLTVFDDKGSASIFREVAAWTPTKTLWVFEHGVVTAIKLTFYASSYAEAKQDTIAKMHASPVEGEPYSATRNLARNSAAFVISTGAVTHSVTGAVVRSAFQNRTAS